MAVTAAMVAALPAAAPDPIASVVVLELEGNGYRLYPDGMTLLNRFRTYEVPEIKEPENDETTDGDQATARG